MSLLSKSHENIRQKYENRRISDHSNISHKVELLIESVNVLQKQYDEISNKICEFKLRNDKVLAGIITLKNILSTKEYSYIDALPKNISELDIESNNDIESDDDYSDMPPLIMIDFDDIPPLITYEDNPVSGNNIPEYESDIKDNISSLSDTETDDVNLIICGCF